MRFLRTLFWVVLAVFLAIMAHNNWSDVTLNLWGNLQADIKIPLLIGIVFLAGFVPPFVVSRGQLWAMKRRLAGQGRPAEVLPNSPAVSPVEADVSHR